MSEMQTQINTLRHDLDAITKVVDNGVEKISKNEEMLSTLLINQTKIEGNIELVKVNMLTAEDFQDVLNKHVAKIFWALIVGVFTGAVAWVVNLVSSK